MFVQNLPALFILFAVMVLMTMGVILWVGFLPLDMAAGGGSTIMMTVLVIATGVAIAGCCVSLLLWTISALPISWSIIAAGLGLLTGPLLFQILPRALRDRPAGLVCTAVLHIAMGSLLAGIVPV